jgi:hypothetical protein
MSRAIHPLGWPRSGVARRRLRRIVRVVGRIWFLAGPFWGIPMILVLLDDPDLPVYVSLALAGVSWFAAYFLLASIADRLEPPPAPS